MLRIIISTFQLLSLQNHRVLIIIQHVKGNDKIKTKVRTKIAAICVPICY